jgi:hypothetical protein
MDASRTRSEVGQWNNGFPASRVSQATISFLVCATTLPRCGAGAFRPFLGANGRAKATSSTSRLLYSHNSEPQNSEYQYHVTISRQDTSMGALNLVFHGKRSPKGSLFLQSAAADPSPCVDLRLHAWPTTSSTPPK